jgi:hypothetical protein
MADAYAMKPLGPAAVSMSQIQSLGYVIRSTDDDDDSLLMRSLNMRMTTATRTDGIT